MDHAEMKNFPTTVVVVAAALIADDGRVLMQKRPAAKQHGGLWEFPGGKVEPGETPESGLIREIREELALQISLSDLVPFAFSSGGGLPAHQVSGHVILLYTCRRWSGEPQNLDAEALGWFLPGELCGLAMPPLDIPLAKTLENWLK